MQSIRLPSEQRDEAIAAVMRGWLVVPLYPPLAADSCACRRRSDCRSVGKHPVWKNWPDLGLRDPHKTGELFQTDFGRSMDFKSGTSTRIGPPTASNVGIATGAVSGIIVLDVDPRNGGDETLFELERRHGALPETVEVLTGGGGRHLYFRHPGDLLANKPIGAGLDMKVDGGLVVGAGSVHSSRRRYAFEIEHHPDDVPVADPPGWLLDRIADTRASGAGTTSCGRTPSSRRDRAAFADLWRDSFGLDLSAGESVHLCPFHADRHHPNLHINADTCMFHCFACGTGGGLQSLQKLVAARHPADVPTALSVGPAYRRAIGTTEAGRPSWKTVPSERSVEPCANGPGIVLRDLRAPSRGRDAQVRCKTKACEVCGPHFRERRIDDVLSDFQDLPMYRVVIDDGGKEWSRLRKQLERSHDHYHRVPAPGGKAVILTNAAIGETVEDREAAVRDAIETQPCNDRRRWSPCREWKKPGHRGPKNFTSEGITRKPQSERIGVYDESGCSPRAVLTGGNDIVSAYEISNLPYAGSAEMRELASRLQLHKREKIELDKTGWPRASLDSGAGRM